MSGGALARHSGPDLVTLASGGLLTCGLALALASACGPKTRPREPSPLLPVPERARTVGDELLAMVPAGADLVLEVDIARLRTNPVMAPLVSELAEQLSGTRDVGPPAGRAMLDPPPGDWLQTMDAVLLCAYHVGREQAAAVTLIRGRVPFGERLDDQTSILAPGEWVARVRSVTAGQTPPLSDDRMLMRERTGAMPARATGGFLRVAARLGFQARVELASRLDLDQVPTAISLWADVADDFALVSRLRGDEPDAGASLAQAATAGLARLAQIPWIRARYLHFILHGVDISAEPTAAQMTLIIGPRRLERLVARVIRSLADGRTQQQSP